MKQVGSMSLPSCWRRPGVLAAVMSLVVWGAVDGRADMQPPVPTSAVASRGTSGITVSQDTGTTMSPSSFEPSAALPGSAPVQPAVSAVPARTPAAKPAVALPSRSVSASATPASGSPLPPPVATKPTSLPVANYPPPAIWPWGDPFEVPTSDGILLRGFYKSPRTPRTTVVVFMTGGSPDFITAFRPLVARLAAKGYGIAAFDTRGVGLSRSTASGGRYDLDPDRQKAEPYKLMIEDTKAVVKYLRESKGVKASRIILCGASVGGNVAIMAAADLPEDIRGVIAVSAGVQFHGLEPLEAAQNLNGRPLLAISSGSDTYSYTLLTEIKRVIPQAETILLSGGAHGHSLLTPETIEKIAVWLDGH